ncbi:Nramp family divalent metal transporter [Streptomyces koyangensis]
MTVLEKTAPEAAPRPAEVTPVRGKRLGATRLAMIGPAFVAAIAYVDPGNFATNFAAGASLGYALLWVVVAASLIAMLVQFLSAKLALATGSNLARLCRDRYPRPLTRALWLQAELVAIATDIAEVIGGAVALALLFDLPLLVGGMLTTLFSFVILSLESRGHRRFEAAVAACLAVIVGAFLWLGLSSGLDTAGVAAGMVPSVPDSTGLLLATGIVGATIMPHAIYLHSDLTRRHVVHSTEPATSRRSFTRLRTDVVLALTIAAVVNGAMLVISARLFHTGTQTETVDTLEGTHAALGTALGGGAAIAFGVALLVSGIAASSVGTYSGQVVMAGFLGRSLPVTLRRLVTVAPGLALLACGVDPTTALLLSQVVLSFGIPFALVPLVRLTSDRALMGPLVNRRLTTAVAICASVLIIALNVLLLFRTATG